MSTNVSRIEKQIKETKELIENLAAKIEAEDNESMKAMFEEQMAKLKEKLTAEEKNLNLAKKTSELTDKDWEKEFKKYPALRVHMDDTIKYGSEISFATNKRARIAKGMAQMGQLKSILLQGPSGTGKTAMISWIGAQVNRPVIHINASTGMTEEDLLGKYVVGEDGKPRFADGPLIMAVRTGSILSIEEINGCKSSVLLKLNSLLDDLSQVERPSDGEIIKAAPGFMLAGTFNKGYAGTRTMNKAFVNRFQIALTVKEVTEAKHREIIKNKIPDASENDIRISWYILKSTQNLFEINDIDGVISVRQSINIIKTKRAQDNMNKQLGLQRDTSWISAIQMATLNQVSGWDEDAQKEVMKVAQGLTDAIDKKTGELDAGVLPQGETFKKLQAAKAETGEGE